MAPPTLAGGHPPNPMPTSISHLSDALALASDAIGLTEPNPRVGCIIVSADGQEVLGRGHTQAAGSAHAEVMALRDAARQGHAVRGATAHVTLEPCSHHGRTPPCCDALIAAGLSRVVVAVEDPNPQVSGTGLARLRAAGIDVEMGPAVIAQAARELNIGFFSRMRRGRPWVRMKVAASLDGRTALDNGVSQWITGPDARLDGHAWRRRAGAVLSGIGTVLADNPRLDVRLVSTPRQPLRVIVDARLQTPPDAQLFDLREPLLFLAATPTSAAVTALQARGADVVCLPGVAGRVDLAAAVKLLGERGINELHVEAGATLNAALLEQDLVDECLVYQAAMLVGPGSGIAALPPLRTLDQARRFEYVDVTPIGPDLRLRLRPQGRAVF